MNFSEDRIINAYETIKFLIELALVIVGSTILGVALGKLFTHILITLLLV